MCTFIGQVASTPYSVICDCFPSAFVRLQVEEKETTIHVIILPPEIFPKGRYGVARFFEGYSFAHFFAEPKLGGSTYPTAPEPQG